MIKLKCLECGRAYDPRSGHKCPTSARSKKDKPPKKAVDIAYKALRKAADKREKAYKQGTYPPKADLPDRICPTCGQTTRPMTAAERKRAQRQRQKEARNAQA